MNADAFSDLVLVFACLALAFKYWRTQSGLAQAAAILGLAASFGVLRFSGLAPAIGPHRFFSLFAACAGLPLLAFAVRWPDDPVARQATAAARFVLLAGAIGLAICLAGFVWWRQVLPVLSVLLILHTVFLIRIRGRIIGALALAGSLGMAALGQPSEVALGPFTALQWMHYLMAVGLLFLSWNPVTDAERTIVG